MPLFTAGQLVTASDLNDLPVGIVGRNQRTSNITSSSGATPIRTLSTIASVVSGRTYRVSAMFEVSAATADATSQNELRYTTDNTEPLVSSTVLNRSLIEHGLSGVPDSVFIEAFFICTATGTFRVALCISRVAGAGNITLEAGATFPATLTVEDMGLTVSTTGTVY